MPQTEAHDKHDGEFVSSVKQKPREALRIVPNLKSQNENSGEIWFKILESFEQEKTKSIKKTNKTENISNKLH